MDAGNQPAGDPLKEETEKRQRQQRELVLAYKRAFATESGQRVLADLLSKYGFDQDGVEKDDFMPGIDALTICHRSSTKGPVRYILRMRNIVLRPLGQEKREGKAKSGLARQA